MALRAALRGCRRPLPAVGSALAAAPVALDRAAAAGLGLASASAPLPPPAAARRGLASAAAQVWGGAVPPHVPLIARLP